MSGSAANQSAGQKAQRIKEVDEKLVQEVHRLTRRRIYFNRLIGDDVLAPKINTQRQAPVTVVIRFLIYTFIATWVIYERAHIPTLAQVNGMLTNGLTDVIFHGGSRPKRFNDIKEPQEFLRWLEFGVTDLVSVPRVGAVSSDRRGALLRGNRIMPELQELCWRNGSAIMLTLNRMQTHSDTDETVTSRFVQLYPETWKSNAHDVADGSKDDQTTETLVRSYSFQSRVISNNNATDKNDPAFLIPDALFGKTASGESLSSSTVRKYEEVWVEWHYTQPCGNHSTRCGFSGEGGYVAVLLLLPGPSGGAFDVSKFVLLLGGDNQVLQPGLGICGSLRISNILTLDDFVAAGFIDSQTSSVVTSFSTYNSNHQTLSSTVAYISSSAAGFSKKPTLRVRTVRLDYYSSYLQYIEILFLIATAFYLIALLSKLYRNYQKHMLDPWIHLNFASIVCSTLSLVFWWSYSSRVDDFHKEGVLPEYADIRDLSTLFVHYQRVGALTTLTIYIRVLRLLADTKPRVKLLLSTLSLSLFNMIVYLSFILVIFVGCLVFANTYFSTYSSNFSSLQAAFTTTFLMVFGDTELFTFESDPPLLLLFYIPYMTFFFIISVQMFNAIINYSYNRVSEEMEPAFERERLEKKRKGSFARTGLRFSRLCASCASLSWLGFKRNRDEDDEDKKKKDKKDDKSGSGKGNAAGLKMGEKVDQVAKDFVDEKIAQERNAKAPETICSMCLYLVFAACYLLFLWVNLKVEDGSMTFSAIHHAVMKPVATRSLPDGDVVHFTLRNISDLGGMNLWVQTALPQVIFENYGQPATTLTDGQRYPPEGRACIATWNCIVPLRPSEGSNASSPLKMIRLTKRVLKLTPNRGGVSNSTPEDESFRTGPDLYSLRTGAEVLDPWSVRLDIEDRSSFQLDFEGSRFCERVGFGDGGFEDNGGIVCVFDADETSFKQQLALLESEAFLDGRTGCASFDFMTYNANTNGVSHVHLHFTQLPSGEVQTELYMSSFPFVDIDEWRKAYWTLSLQLVPGLMYLCLTFTFISFMIKDLRNEIIRRQRNERRHSVWIVIDYFMLDVFNAIDLLSFFISIASSCLFIAVLVEESQLTDDPPFETGLEEISALHRLALVYKQMSAVNALVIFIRPLKFLRESPRIAMFNQTLWNATVDTSWFVVMFFITMLGFMMFAYLAFGPSVPELSNILGAFNFCFYHVVGAFSFSKVLEADSFMAWLWFIPFLFIFYCFFLNMFFAIIDRYFLTAEPQAVNFKRKLKPIFGRFCRWVEWDEDFVMDVDHKTKAQHTATMSRRQRVHKTAEEIQKIWDSAQDEGLTINAAQGEKRKSKQLSDICEPDERMTAVLMWSRDQAKAFVDEYQERLNKKQADKNDESFLRWVKDRIERARRAEQDEMEFAERQKRYAIQVHEKMAMKDQDTLARYILTLERKIEEKMLHKHRLQVEVQHLRAESEKMRFTDTELKADKEEDPAHHLSLDLRNGRPSQNGTALVTYAEEPERDVHSNASSDDSFYDESFNAAAASTRNGNAARTPRGGIRPPDLSIEYD